MAFPPYKQGSTEAILEQHSIKYVIRGDELLTDCFFGDCDDDSRQNEHHLSFNLSTGQYHCFKCGAKGNFITLKRYLKERR